MGKASKNKQSSSQTNKQASRQDGKLINRQAIHILIIVVLGLLAYSNTFQSPFQWDEADFIVDNPIVKDFAFFKDISRAEGLPAYDSLKSRYIGYLTFALNYKVHGLSVAGYHVVNLAIHLINAALVYFLVLLTFRTPFFSDQQSATSNQQPGEKSKQYAVSSMQSTAYSLFMPLAVALLFVSHPVQTEAVTYIFQRLASLVSMFYMMSLVFYIKGRLETDSRQYAVGSRQQKETKQVNVGDKQSTAYSLLPTPYSSSSSTPYSLLPTAYYFLSLLCAILAMKTKENAFTLPVIITLYEFMFFSGPVKTRLLRLAPFLITMLIVPLTIMGTGSTPGEIISQVKDPVSQGYVTPAPQDYLFTQFRVIVTYLRLLLLPVGQNIDYDYPLYQSFFTPPVLFSFLFLASLFGAAVWLIYRSWQADKPASLQAGSGEDGGVFHYSPFTIHYSRLLSFGVLWFFITLSVESSIIPIPMLINEYRVYLPSVGFFIAIMSGVLFLFQRYTGRSKQYAVSSKQPTTYSLLPTSYFLLLTSCFLVVLALASATYARNALWKEKITLWEDVVRKSPNSPRGYSNLGSGYSEKGFYDKAKEMYERCLALRPSHLQANVNLGVAYAVTGRPDLAIQYFTRAIAINPGNSTAYLNLGRAYNDVGHPDKAVENYRTAIGLNPYNSSAYHGMGTAYVRLGLLGEALAAYTRFMELSPDNPEAYRNRGNVYAYKGDFVNAAADYQKACSLGSRESCENLKRLR